MTRLRHFVSCNAYTAVFFAGWFIATWLLLVFGVVKFSV